ncbi:MAG: hypothetical protein ACRKGH_03525 [Dehalogenimonas sp.]
MNLELQFTPTASEQLSALEGDPNFQGILRQVRKTLGLLETDIRSKSLQTHEFESLTRRYQKKVFEAYAQNQTSGAYRVFWHYGPDEKDQQGQKVATITIVAMTPHP